MILGGQSCFWLLYSPHDQWCQHKTWRLAVQSEPHRIFLLLSPLEGHRHGGKWGGAEVAVGGGEEGGQEIGGLRIDDPKITNKSEGGRNVITRSRSLRAGRES